MTCAHSAIVIRPLGAALPEFRNVPEIGVKLLINLNSGIPEEKIDECAR
jgi:hypothetical protein